MERVVESEKRGRFVEVPTLAVEYVPAEQNLETIGYFSARYKRRYPTDKQRSKVVALSGGRRMEIIPSAKYGFPNADDLDFYRAFLKICDERATFVQAEEDGQVTLHPRLPSPIGFRTREIIAKAGRVKSARETAAVREWIERLNATVVHGELYDARIKKYNAKIGLEPLFRKFIHVGRPTEEGDVASMNYVWLADWFIDNYFYYYVRRVDLKFHQRLSRPIAKSLYPLLDNGWFAANGAAFTKRYGELCTFLDIQPYKQLSRVQQQIDPSHEELCREKFLVSYEYVLNEQGKWTGSIRWCPGPKWFFDQEQKKRRKETTDDISISTLLRPDVERCGLASPTPQIPLPFGSQHSAVHTPYGERVSRFYAELGYERVSLQKITAGIRVMMDLIERQHYQWKEIEIALAWIVRNRSKFGQEIYSLNLLPHVIEQALGEDKKARAQEQRKLQAGDEQEARAKHEELQDLLEQKFSTLSHEEQEQLRMQAVERLAAEGVKAAFLRESVIRSEMLHLLAQDSPPGVFLPNEQGKARGT